MKLAYTLAVLAITATAIQMTADTKDTEEELPTLPPIPYAHNNCGLYDEFEDCREAVFLEWITTGKDYDTCVEGVMNDMMDDCGGDEDDEEGNKMCEDEV